MNEDETKTLVRSEYAKVAKACGAEAAECCPSDERGRPRCCTSSYSPEELQSIPEGAELGLGCGNPTALASLKDGETVVDLGSGAGVDCFLAANKVGRGGRVIGVDMTPEMVDAARRNAKANGYGNVEFRLGEIENLPIADNTADIVISNCVINLSPAKDRVFREAFRILRPGGRMAVSDIVLLRDLPAALKEDQRYYVACVAGAALKEDYLAMMTDAGFRQIEVVRESSYPADDSPGRPCEQRSLNVGLQDGSSTQAVGSIASIEVMAFKPDARIR